MSDRMVRPNRLVILTPEGIAFGLPLAGPIARFLAWIIDLIAVVVLIFALYSFLNFFGLVFPDWAAAATVAGAYLILTGYAIVLEWFNRGQTIGKRVLQLRVVDEQGLKLQFSQVALRNLLRVVDILPALYLLGGSACLLSKRSQRLGDLAANTVVIRAASIGAPDLNQIAGDKFNSFRAFPHLCARLRQLVSPEEADLALSALIRRDELAPDARVRVFTAYADHFRGKVTFPEDATLGLSDEQYVRNVVELVFQPGSESPVRSAPPKPARAGSARVQAS